MNCHRGPSVIARSQSASAHLMSVGTTVRHHSAIGNCSRAEHGASENVVKTGCCGSCCIVNN